MLGVAPEDRDIGSGAATSRTNSQAPRAARHVAFGGNVPHFCLGAALARLELCVMSEELLRRLPDIELARDGPLPLRTSNFSVGIEEMPVVFTPG